MKNEIALKWERFSEDWNSKFGKKPTIESVLLIIGWQEVPAQLIFKNKQVKTDLIHVGMCTVLSLADIYIKSQIDQDGWPHFEQLVSIEKNPLQVQEEFIKENILKYFQID
ncbi:MAG: hypothetical protein ORN85_04255 [Sediminibacterium sp.]|nr:hypothetical protein [Sediminibacterium sp.]